MSSSLPLVSFFVAGTPRTAGSKRAFPIRDRSGRLVRIAVTDSSGAEGKAWRSQVRDAAIAAFGDFKGLLAGPLSVSFTFYVERPWGHYGSGKNAEKLKSSAPAYPCGRPDALKMARSVEDSLTGVIYHDDAQIVTELLAKRYGERPGVQVDVFAEPLAAAQLPEARQLGLL